MERGKNLSILHMICGLPGSGKSTLAKKLSASPKTIWLSADEWMYTLFGDKAKFEMYSKIETLQWRLADKLLRSGVDVVLDHGFWTKSKRYMYYSMAKKIPADFKLYYLDTDHDILRIRINERLKKRVVHDFYISQDELDHCIRSFEPPDASEIESSTRPLGKSLKPEAPPADS